MSKPYTIEVFDDEKHRAEVIGLWRAVFGYEDPHNAPALVIDKKLAENDGLFFVASNGPVIGTVMGGYDGHRGWIYSLAVANDSRRLGVGSSLVNHLESELRELGCVKINLQILVSNHAVAEFYENLGYKVEERISMGKKL